MLLLVLCASVSRGAIALAQQKFFIYVAILPKPVVSVTHAVYVTSLRPTIPKRIRPMQYQPQRRRLTARRKYVRTHWAPRSPAQSSTSAPSRGMGGSGVPGLIVRAYSQAA